MTPTAKSSTPAETFFWALQNTLGVWATGRATHEVAVRAILTAMADNEDPGPVLDVYVGFVGLRRDLYRLQAAAEPLRHPALSMPILERVDRCEVILQALGLLRRILRERQGSEWTGKAADLDWAYRKAGDDIREMDLVLRSFDWTPPIVAQ